MPSACVGCVVVKRTGQLASGVGGVEAARIGTTSERLTWT